VKNFLCGNGCLVFGGNWGKLVSVHFSVVGQDCCQGPFSQAFCGPLDQKTLEKLRLAILLTHHPFFRPPKGGKMN
jgi:hypothetical protein